MGKTYLFSPVGGTDPISPNNLRDGSMLHICRHYQPDKVYLYMSSEMLAHHHKDKRYTYCIDKLSEKLGKNIDVEIIERPDMKKVQEFDYFYKDFGEIIDRIFSEMNRDDRLLLNISSGTPAMKSSLLVLNTIKRFRSCTTVQTITPEGKMNNRSDSEKPYDVQELWDKDKDNGDSAENRCDEIECPSLTVIHNEEIIKRFLDKYNYKAASAIVDTMPLDETAAYRDLIRMAEKRLDLELDEIDELLNNRKYCPQLEDDYARTLFEYALSLQIKQDQGELADFLRALSPLFTGLFILTLKNAANIDLKDYCSKDLNMWMFKKLSADDKGQKILKVIDKYGNMFKDDRPVYVSADHLNNLIQHFAEDTEIVKTASRLRDVERKLRNLAAHDIVSISEERIHNKVNRSSKEIMGDIKAMFDYAMASKINGNYWGSYKTLNSDIAKLIDNNTWVTRPAKTKMAGTAKTAAAGSAANSAESSSANASRKEQTVAPSEASGQTAKAAASQSFLARLLSLFRS